MMKKNPKNYTAKSSKINYLENPYHHIKLFDEFKVEAIPVQRNSSLQMLLKIYRNAPYKPQAKLSIVQ